MLENKVNIDVPKKDIHDRELLLHDYSMCHAGYTSRDRLVAQEFTQFLTSFVLFLSIMAAAKALKAFNENITLLVIVLLFIGGTCALIAYLINIRVVPDVGLLKSYSYATSGSIVSIFLAKIGHMRAMLLYNYLIFQQ